jgi:hypothetical protein
MKESNDLAVIRHEPEPGVMHPIDQAFYDLAIKERDYERRRVDRLQAQADDAYRSLHAGRIAEAMEYLRTMRGG